MIAGEGETERSGQDAGLLGAPLWPVLDAAPVVVFALDRAGVFVLSRGGGLHPLGLRSGQVLGRAVTELYADQPWVLAAVGRALGGESFSSMGLVGRSWYQVTYAPWWDAARRIVGAVGCAVEVTSWVHSREVLEGSGAVVWVADARTLALRFVGQGEQQPGPWRASERFFSDHLHPDEREVTLGLLRATAADGRTRQAAHRIVDPDGQERWYLTTVRALRAPGRAGDEIIGTSVDITERTRAEQALAERESRMRLMLEQLPAVVWTTDRELRFTTGAGAVLAALGLRADQLGGVSLFDYFHTSDPDDPNIAPHRRVLATGRSERWQADWIGRAYQVHLEPFRDAGGQVIGTIGLAWDVTDLRRAERERDELLGRERAARLAAEAACRLRDDFLSVASHELRTPLTTLQLAVQRAARVADPERRERALAIADGQVQRLVRLVDQLLDVARIQGGRLEMDRTVGDLAEVVRATVTQLRPELEAAGCSLDLRAPGPVAGRFDRDRIEQVVTNLIANALKFGARRPIQVEVTRHGDVGRLVVRDQGVGIVPERLGAVFDRFERAVPSRQYGGLGLGLYIVKQIVAAHGGAVMAESAPGQGATFTVELPL